MKQRVIEWTDPSVVRAKAAASSGLEYFEAMQSGALPAPPMLVLMNVSLRSFERGRIVFAAEPGEEHYNPHGVVHGGYAATVFDTALGCAVYTLIDRQHAYTTLELHVNLVRPVTHAAGRLLCEARVLYEGKRIATAEAKLTNERGRLYGHATTTCLIMERPATTDGAGFDREGS